MFIEQVLLKEPEEEVALEKIADFYEMFSPNYANFYRELIRKCPEDERKLLYDSTIQTGYLNIILRPLKDMMTIDTLAAIDAKYPIFHQRDLYYPVKNSEGKYRYVKALRPVIASKEYFIRLKQFAEEKFSVTSISAVNIKNENSKSRNSKLYLSRFSNTPIRFGCMETEDLIHMGILNVILFELIYSASPNERNSLIELYYGDPVEINVEVDMNSTNVYVQGFMALFKELGCRLKHTKHFKEYIPYPVKILDYKEAPYYIKFEANNNKYYIREEKKDKDEKYDKKTGVHFRIANAKE
jgi:hypothetical protein